MKRHLIPCGVMKVPDAVFDNYCQTRSEQWCRWWHAYYLNVLYARGPDGWYIAQDPLQ